VKRRDAAFISLARRLRSFVKRTVPKVEENLNPWGLPSFDLNGPLAYFMVGKHHVTFGFARGSLLNDPHNLLEGTGKNLRHVKIRSQEDLQRSGLLELVQQAGELNLQQPNIRGKSKG
jgi:hypothetical protein